MTKFNSKDNKQNKSYKNGKLDTGFIFLGFIDNGTESTYIKPKQAIIPANTRELNIIKYFYKILKINKFYF